MDGICSALNGISKMNYGDVGLRKAFGPYAVFLSVSFLFATIVVYLYLTLFDDQAIVRRLGIEGLSLETCVSASYWIANSIYISHKLLSIVVFFSFVVALYFSYKFNSLLFVGVAIVVSLCIFPFAIVFLSSNVFIIPSLLGSSCSHGGASVFYILVLMINMMSAYVISGVAYFLFKAHRDGLGRD